MEEGNDVKSRAVTSLLILMDVVEPMVEVDGAKLKVVTSWLKLVGVV